MVLALATAASSLIKNGAAVGSGIFLLPVLALVFPPKIALGLGAPVMLASDLMGIRNYWGEWDDWHEILRIILAASVGIALGGTSSTSCRPRSSSAPSACSPSPSRCFNCSRTSADSRAP